MVVRNGDREWGTILLVAAMCLSAAVIVSPHGRLQDLSCSHGVGRT